MHRQLYYCVIELWHCKSYGGVCGLWKAAGPQLGKEDHLYNYAIKEGPRPAKVVYVPPTDLQGFLLLSVAPLHHQSLILISHHPFLFRMTSFRAWRAVGYSFVSSF